MAALIAEMDLVITVDSTEAHLAGALGVPAWVMLPHNANWRWLRDRESLALVPRHATVSTGASGRLALGVGAGGAQPGCLGRAAELGPAHPGNCGRGCFPLCLLGYVLNAAVEVSVAD